MQFPRLFWWLVATILLLVVISLLAPQQLPVSLYKLSLVTMAGVVGYWLDRSIFPYARPDSFVDIDDDFEDVDLNDIDETKPLSADSLRFPGGYVKTGDGSPVDIGQFVMAMVFSLAMLRRALIVGAAMLAIGLGA